MNLLVLPLVIGILVSKCLLFELGQSAPDIIHVGAPNSCHHVYINQTFGILTSPYFPLGYPDNTFCQWKIKMADGLRIVILMRSFKLGPGDRLEVLEENSDGRSEYSLKNPPNDVIYSTSNSVILRLTASVYMSSINDARDTAIKELRKNRTFYAIFEVEGCGGFLNEASGHITVPSYIHLSQRSHECVWTITSPKNKVIVLNFLQFDLTPGTCLYSKLHIRDGDKKAGYVLGDFCEENPPLHELRTSTNVMYISYRSRPNFLSSHTEMVPTIRMFYRIADVCGGTFTAFSGSFSAPRRWPDDVYICNWTINVPHEKQVLLRIYNWKTRNATDYDVLSLIVPNELSRSWTSKDSERPRSSMIIASNQLSLSLSSHREKSSIAKLEFYCVYEAVTAPTQSCINVGKQRFFMCDEWKYIDCHLRCNGDYDCDNGKDEEECQSLKLDSALLDLHHGDHHRKSINISVYFTFLFVAICVSLVIVVSSLTFNRFYKNAQRVNTVHKPKRRISQLNYYPNIHPPPYGSREMCTVSAFYRAPPPYPYSFDETALTNESSLRLSLVAVSVANQTANETQCTDTTDRLQEADVPLDRSEYTRSMDTLFLNDESTLQPTGMSSDDNVLSATVSSDPCDK